jgi:cell division protein FtsQ
VVIDPRISARRIAVQRAEGQRRLHRLLWVGGCLALAVLALGATRTPLLDLDDLDVRGADPAAVAEALAPTGIRRGTALVDVDLAEGRAALEALPWVAKAELRRAWPGTLEVRVVARQPVASVAVAGGAALVAEDGVVVAVGDGTADLVPVEGPATLAPGDRLDQPEQLAVAAALPAELRPLVASVGAGDGAGAVVLHLAEGGLVRLGAADQLEPKLLAALTVLTQVDRACLAILDVRVPSAPTVTRGPRC